jgi:hypothetical protein
MPATSIDLRVWHWIEGMPAWHRLYVILLDDGAGYPGTGDRGHVYVGESSLEPEVRFAKHKAGGRSASTVVTTYGMQLMPVLYEHIGAFRTREEVEAAEKQLRSVLLARGGASVAGPPASRRKGSAGANEARPDGLTPPLSGRYAPRR